VPETLFDFGFAIRDSIGAHGLSIYMERYLSFLLYDIPVFSLLSFHYSTKDHCRRLAGQ